jgi:5'(3')-deoxyribonucleotidase
MLRRKRVWVDVDEVLAQFQNAVLQIVERKYGRKIDPYSFEQWDLFGTFPEDERKFILAECEQPGFCAGLLPVPGAVEGMSELRKHADVFAATSHFHSQTWVYERDRWLAKHFGFDRNTIIHTASKFLIRTDACLDDKPDTVVAWAKEHPTGLAMLWPIPNTRNLPLDEYRVRDWDDVVRRVIDHKVD